jgi:hypothetical protein
MITDSHDSVRSTFRPSKLTSINNRTLDSIMLSLVDWLNSRVSGRVAFRLSERSDIELGEEL